MMIVFGMFFMGMKAKGIRQVVRKTCWMKFYSYWFNQSVLSFLINDQPSNNPLNVNWHDWFFFRDKFFFVLHVCQVNVKEFLLSDIRSIIKNIFQKIWRRRLKKAEFLFWVQVKSFIQSTRFLQTNSKCIRINIISNMREKIRGFSCEITLQKEKKTSGWDIPPRIHQILNPV